MRHAALDRRVEEVLRQLEAEEEREKEALRRFYERNAAPHYSGSIRNWWRNLPLYKRCGWVGGALIVLAGVVILAWGFKP